LELTIKRSYSDLENYNRPNAVSREQKYLWEDGIDGSLKANDQHKLNITKRVYRGLTVKTVEKIADAIARKIAFAYQDQVQLL
jgi:response regulator of citrate/malate metabolism